MEGNGDTELLCPGPYRVVVVGRVEAELIQPEGVTRHLRIVVSQCVEGTLHVAGAEHRLEAQFGDRVLQFGVRFLWSVHRDGGNRRQTVGVAGECLRIGPV